MKRTTTLAAAAVMGLALSANAMADVKIGLLTTLTGPGSVLGQDQLDGFMPVSYTHLTLPTKA